MNGVVSRSPRLFVLLVLLLFQSQPPARAHEDLELQIADLTRELRNHPASAEIYFQRAELHRIHRDWTNATADYGSALKLNAHLLGVYLARGQMFHESGQEQEALGELDYYLDLCPTDARGYSARARVLSALRRNPEAAADFQQALSRNPTPSASDYLETARALSACGTNRITEAVRLLKEAARRLGDSLMFENLVVDLELERGNFDAALQQVEATIRRVPRKEWAVARRAGILERAGRPQEALAAYEQCLGYLGKLPPGLRGVRALQQLESEVREGIKRLGPTATGRGIVGPP